MLADLCHPLIMLLLHLANSEMVLLLLHSQHLAKLLVLLVQPAWSHDCQVRVGRDHM